MVPPLARGGGQNINRDLTNMYLVYLLKDDLRKKYIGRTNDLDRRMQEHKAGKVYTTKKMQNPSLYYYEAYLTEDLSKEREHKLKQYGSSYVGLLKRIGLK